MTITLTIEALACARGGRILFRDLSVCANSGEVLGIEGPNGAGKTTLLRLVAGFLAPISGFVRLTTECGTITDAEERGRAVGWLGHQDSFKSQFTVGEQLGFFASLYGVTTDITAALVQVGLARQRDLLCRYLSAGQRKRLALARLALSARPLWLLDEPFAALDASGKALALDLIADHAAGGGLALVATHEQLDQGRLMTLRRRQLTLGADP